MAFTPVEAILAIVRAGAELLAEVRLGHARAIDATGLARMIARFIVVGVDLRLWKEEFSKPVSEHTVLFKIELKPDSCQVDLFKMLRSTN